MRRSAVLCRGAKGVGWYDKYTQAVAAGGGKAAGQAAFKHFEPPTPYIWLPTNRPRVQAYFDMSVEGNTLGRLVFELADDILPKSVDNFLRLCGETISDVQKGINSQGSSSKGLSLFSYKNSRIHNILKGSLVMGGDVESESHDGSGNHSSFANEKYFKDENFIIPHSERGLLGYASSGVHSNGSQFYISLAAAPHLNGRCVNFGRLVEGHNVLNEIEKVYCFRGVPARPITISGCGVIRTGDNSNK